jgi:hypothetical protein
MSAVILDIAGILARRKTLAACDELRSAMDREIARIDAEVERKRANINAHLNRIENDIDWRRPTDSEVPFT